MTLDILCFVELVMRTQQGENQRNWWMGPNEGSRVHPLVKMRDVLLETSGQPGALCTPSPASFSHFTTVQQGKSAFCHL